MKKREKKTLEEEEGDGTKAKDPEGRRKWGKVKKTEALDRCGGISHPSGGKKREEELR